MSAAPPAWLPGIVVTDLRAAEIDVRFAGAHAPGREYAARLGHVELAGLVESFPTVAAAVAQSGTR